MTNISDGNSDDDSGTLYEDWHEDLDEEDDGMFGPVEDEGDEEDDEGTEGDQGGIYGSVTQIDTLKKALTTRTNILTGCPCSGLTIRCKSIIVPKW